MPDGYLKKQNKKIKKKERHGASREMVENMKYTFTDTRTNEESEIFDSFAKLKNYFEPDENELPDEWDKWEQIDDLYDLK